VARDHLGLFDAPPDRREIRLGIAIVGLLFAAVLIIMPLRDVRLIAIIPFVPVINAVMLVGELTVATLLYAQASIFRSRALTVLASGYVFAALLLIPHALTFPGAFSETGLLGAGVNTTGWTAAFRRFGFPIAVILYACLKWADSGAPPQAERPPARVFAGVAGAVGLAALGTLLATSGHDLLPPLFLNNREAILANLMILNSVAIILTLAAIALLYWRDKSVLDMWLLVAMSGWLFQSVVNLPLNARFTLGWYGLFGMMMASSFIIVLALIAESNRLYARLALATAARKREREARLLSLDAVAAALAHEISQPLAAIKLSAAAGLEWLNRERPETEKAIQSLNEALNAGHRTFEVIKSIRATFSQGSGALSKFNPNDLVRETVLLLDKEFVVQRISLRLALDEAVPTILANRVQLQRVLINLLTNAIESVSATRRTRSIEVRSVPSNSRGVLLEVNDSGVGIGSDEIGQIFDPFFTTKPAGTGLGLSLSRTIIEEHGGRLWASAGHDQGATFHIQLPPSAPSSSSSPASTPR